VVGVSTDDARAYAAWLTATGRVPHARVCSEFEWERAARGADDRTFPGGDDLQPDDANIDVTYGRRKGAYGPDEVGSHPASRSPFGVDDMAGNVWEPTESATSDSTLAVARGSDFYQEVFVASSTNRQVSGLDVRDTSIGVRICGGPLDAATSGIAHHDAKKG
jgi:formylglycine-generating enzyme required for sulfatase activity